MYVVPLALNPVRLWSPNVLLRQVIVHGYTSEQIIELLVINTTLLRPEVVLRKQSSVKEITE